MSSGKVKVLITEGQLAEVLMLIDRGLPVERIANKYGTSQQLIVEIKIRREIPKCDVIYNKPGLCKRYNATKKYAVGNKQKEMKRFDDARGKSYE